jgi:hypothetical protein
MVSAPEMKGMVAFFNLGSDIAGSATCIPGAMISARIAKCGLGLFFAADATRRARYGLDCVSQMLLLVWPAAYPGAGLAFLSLLFVLQRTCCFVIVAN